MNVTVRDERRRRREGNVTERFLLGQVLSFRGENDHYSKTGAQLEITDVAGETVEIAADVGNLRVYFKFSLPEFLRQVMRAGTP